MSVHRRFRLLFASLVLNGTVLVAIAQGHYSHILVAVWLGSIVLCALGFSNSRVMLNSLAKFARSLSPYDSPRFGEAGGDSAHLANLPTSLRNSSFKHFWMSGITLVLLAEVVLVVRIAQYDLTRIHGDDVLTAYFSSQYDVAHQPFFAAFPPDPNQWVAQFPTLYFFFQKLFFLVAGTTFLTVKLSVLPYVLVASVALFLIARELSGLRFAIIAVILHAFFAPSVYLETLALHFTASTAVYLVFFYFLLKLVKTRSSQTGVALGIAGATSYLFYLTSYIAFPMMVLTFVILLVRYRKKALGSIFAALFAFGVTLSPFLVFALRSNAYFLHRVDQVALLSGSWSSAPARIATGESKAHILLESFTLSLRSLGIDGIGGNGGYNFGHVALLNPVSLLLVVGGVFIFLIRSLTKFAYGLNGDLTGGWILVLLTVVFSFAAMVFSAMPPAFHRFSLAFPFLTLVMAIPIEAIVLRVSRSRRAGIVIIGLILFVYISAQGRQFQRSTAAERSVGSIRLARELISQYPGRTPLIAAFPGFAFDSVYYFASGGSRRTEADYHAHMLNRLDPSAPYVVVMIYPDDFGPQFQAKDPHGHFTRFSPEFGVFAN